MFCYKLTYDISGCLGCFLQYKIIMSFDLFSCEVIKDQKTEESLQYAFIEFEKVCLSICTYLIFCVCVHT